MNNSPFLRFSARLMTQTVVLGFILVGCNKVQRDNASGKAATDPDGKGPLSVTQMNMANDLEYAKIASEEKREAMKLSAAEKQAAKDQFASEQQSTNQVAIATINQNGENYRADQMASAQKNQSLMNTLGVGLQAGAQYAGASAGAKAQKDAAEIAALNQFKITELQESGMNKRAGMQAAVSLGEKNTLKQTTALKRDMDALALLDGKLAAREEALSALRDSRPDTTAADLKSQFSNNKPVLAAIGKELEPYNGSLSEYKKANSDPKKIKEKMGTLKTSREKVMAAYNGKKELWAGLIEAGAGGDPGLDVLDLYKETGEAPPTVAGKGLSGGSVVGPLAEGGAPGGGRRLGSAAPAGEGVPIPPESLDSVRKQKEIAFKAQVDKELAGLKFKVDDDGHGYLPAESKAELRRKLGSLDGWSSDTEQKEKAIEAIMEQVDKSGGMSREELSNALTNTYISAQSSGGFLDNAILSSGGFASASVANQKSSRPAAKVKDPLRTDEATSKDLAAINSDTLATGESFFCLAEPCRIPNLDKDYDEIRALADMARNFGSNAPEVKAKAAEVQKSINSKFNYEGSGYSTTEKSVAENTKLAMINALQQAEGAPEDFLNDSKNETIYSYLQDQQNQMKSMAVIHDVTRSLGTDVRPATPGTASTVQGSSLAFNSKSQPLFRDPGTAAEFLQPESPFE